MEAFKNTKKHHKSQLQFLFIFFDLPEENFAPFLLSFDFPFLLTRSFLLPFNFPFLLTPLFTCGTAGWLAGPSTRVTSSTFFFLLLFRLASVLKKDVFVPLRAAVALLGPHDLRCSRLVSLPFPVGVKAL